MFKSSGYLFRISLQRLVILEMQRSRRLRSASSGSFVLGRSLSNSHPKYARGSVYGGMAGVGGPMSDVGMILLVELRFERSDRSSVGSVPPS